MTSAGSSRFNLSEEFAILNDIAIQLTDDRLCHALSSLYATLCSYRQGQRKLRHFHDIIFYACPITVNVSECTYLASLDISAESMTKKTAVLGLSKRKTKE